MTLENIGGQIKICAEQMNSRYGGVVFDEWVVVSLERNRARILQYTGPRNDDFLKSFVTDLGALRTSLLDSSYGAGDFEFARHGVGTGIEAFLVLGPGLYLICNNTVDSMDGITKNPPTKCASNRWRFRGTRRFSPSSEGVEALGRVFKMILERARPGRSRLETARPHEIIGNCRFDDIAAAEDGPRSTF
jgi:hypothetical protein